MDSQQTPDSQPATPAKPASPPSPARLSVPACSVRPPPSPARLPPGDSVQAKQARSSLQQAELEAKYKEELRWHKKEIDYLKTELEAKRSRLASAEEAAATATARAEAVTVELDRLRMPSAEQLARIERIATERSAALRAEVDALKTQLVGAQRTADSATADVAEAKRTAARAAEESSALRAQLDADQAGVTQLSAALRERDAGLQTLLQGLQQAEAEAVALRDERRPEHSGQSISSSGTMATDCPCIIPTPAAIPHTGPKSASVSPASTSSQPDAAPDLVTQCLALLNALQAKQRSAAQQALTAEERCAAAKAELAASQASVSALEGDLADLRRTTGVGATSFRKVQEKLASTEAELAELQAEYSKGKFEFALAKAESNEAAIKLLKAKKQAAIEREELESQLGRCQGQLSAVHEVHLRVASGLQDLEQDAVAAGGSAGSDGGASHTERLRALRQTLADAPQTWTAESPRSLPLAREHSGMGPGREHAGLSREHSGLSC